MSNEGPTKGIERGDASGERIRGLYGTSIWKDGHGGKVTCLQNPEKVTSSLILSMNALC